MVRTARLLSTVALFITLLLAGCMGWRPARVPMPSRFYPAVDARAKGLIVLLPGRGDGVSRYEQKGFVDIVRRTRPGFDVVAADAHFGYFKGEFEVVPRLHEDVIAPIQDRYEEIWLLGISIGGLVATTYAMDHPDVVDGVIVLAPFLGWQSLIREIADAGGLDEWEPPALAEIPTYETRHMVRLWTWFKRLADGEPLGADLYLGCGEDDRLIMPARLVGAHLSPGRFVQRPGGHTWNVWTPLFETLIDRAIGETPVARRPDSPSETGSSADVEASGDPRS